MTIFIVSPGLALGPPGTASSPTAASRPSPSPLIPLAKLNSFQDVRDKYIEDMKRSAAARNNPSGPIVPTSGGPSSPYYTSTSRPPLVSSGSSGQYTTAHFSQSLPVPQTSEGGGTDTSTRSLLGAPSAAEIQSRSRVSPIKAAALQRGTSSTLPPAPLQRTASQQSVQQQQQQQSFLK
jgi:hypothetical protein